MSNRKLLILLTLPIVNRFLSPYYYLSAFVLLYLAGPGPKEFKSADSHYGSYISFLCSLDACIMKFMFWHDGPPSLLPIEIPIRLAGLLLLCVVYGWSRYWFKDSFGFMSLSLWSMVLLTADFALPVIRRVLPFSLTYYYYCGSSNTVSEALA